MATQNQSGASLTAMQAQMNQMQSMFDVLMSKMAGVPTAEPANVQAEPVFAQPVQAAPAKGKGKKAAPVAAPVQSAPVAFQWGSAPASKSAERKHAACGSKPKKDGSIVLCTRCNGRYNPVKHMCLGFILPLDGKGAVDVNNPWGRKYMGLSADPNDSTYHGNCVVVGIGKDTLNLRPWTLLELGSLLPGMVAHAKRNLRPDMLVAPVKDSE